MSCHHCGQAHAEGVLKCPATGFLISAPGLVGQRVDRYSLERLLGAGGFGTVYRARHVHTDATVALKLLKKELGADPSMIDRFLREAKAAGAVGSEHIVGVLDAGVTDGQPFLALEFLDGWDLQDLAYREGAEPQRVVQIVLQVLAGLGAAHAKGIVHRDMKPANVFVIQREGRDFAKLLDFGISKMHQDASSAGLTMTGLAMGTPAYMAPEQFFDAKSVDGRADLYSVAVMLYELLSKRLPFEATSYADLVVKVRTEVPPPLASVAPGLPAVLCAVVDRGLTRDRDQRWQTTQQMADALRAVGWMPEALKATPAPTDSASMIMGATAPPRQATPAPVPLAATAPPAPAPAAAPAKKSVSPVVIAVISLVLVASLAVMKSRASALVTAERAGMVGTWILDNTDCPAGVMPKRTRVTQSAGQAVSRAPGLPDTAVTVESDGSFIATNVMGTCRGKSDGRFTVQTCTNNFGQSCHATYRLKE